MAIASARGLFPMRPSNQPVKREAVRNAATPSAVHISELQHRITLTVGPTEISRELVSALIAQSGGDPESITPQRLQAIVDAGPELLRRLADEPAMLIQFTRDPAGVLAGMGIEPIGNPEALQTDAHVAVVSDIHVEAVNELQQQIVQRLARDEAWTAEYRVDPIAAIIEMGRGQPATIVAEAIRTLTISVQSGANVSPKSREHAQALIIGGTSHEP